MDNVEWLTVLSQLIAERDEARKLAQEYCDALRALYAVPETEALPWEVKDE